MYNRAQVCHLKLRGKICFLLFNKLKIRSYNLQVVNIYYNISTFIIKIKSIIIVGLKKAQLFYLISKTIKSKANRLFNSIKYFRKHQNLVVVAIVKEFGLFNIDFLLKLRIEKCYLLHHIGVNTIDFL